MIGLVLATAAAVAFGTGTFIQHMTAQAVETPSGRQRTQHGLFELLLSLVRRPRWLLGQALAGGGTLMQFTALAFAPVAVVEPIVGGGLVVAIVGEAVHERQRPGPRLVAGLLLCVGGLVTFLLFSQASAPRHDPGLFSAATLVILGVTLALVSRFASAGRAGSALAGLAAGGCLGVAVVAVAVPISRLKTQGFQDTLTDWSPYVAITVGLLATAATQQAYVRGELAWSLPALTVADPLTATILSVVLLREQLDAATAPVWAAGAVVAALGVALSAASRTGGSVTGDEPASLTRSGRAT